MVSSAKSAPRSSGKRRRSRPRLRKGATGLILAGLQLSLTAAGCGIPTGEHAAVHRDLERAKAETAQIARRCEDGDTEARRHLDTCDRARTGAEAGVKLLTGQLLSLKEQRGELAGDLRMLEEHVQRLQAERQAAVDRRRRRLTITERFAALSEAVPELKGLTPAVVQGRLTVALPLAMTDGALDRIAEALRALPEARWRVEAGAPRWADASTAAVEIASKLADRGVPAERLQAAARRLPGGAAGTRTLVRVPDLTAVPGFEAPGGRGAAPVADPPPADAPHADPPPVVEPPPDEEHE